MWSLIRTCVRGQPRLARTLGAVGLLGGTLGCDAARAALRPFHGTVYDPPASAPALRLPAAGGGTFDLARTTADSGRAALVFFGYTHCPDVCPTTLADWSRVRRLLGRDADRVRFVFVAVDPERDSADVVRRYVTRFDPAIVGVAPSRAEVDATMRAWRVAAYREAGPDSAYTVAHPAQTFAVDAQGRLRLHHALGAAPADVADDVRKLLD
jgi:protein SCO1/2